MISHRVPRHSGWLRGLRSLFVTVTKTYCPFSKSIRDMNCSRRI